MPSCLRWSVASASSRSRRSSSSSISYSSSRLSARSAATLSRRSAAFLLIRRLLQTCPVPVLVSTLPVGQHDPGALAWRPKSLRGFCYFAMHNRPPAECQRIVTEQVFPPEGARRQERSDERPRGIDACLAAAVSATVHPLYGFDCSNGAPRRAGVEPVPPCALPLGLHRGLRWVVDAGHV